MKAALFDLDRTLLDCNSGRLWMQFELRHGRISWADAVWASWYLARYHFGMDGAERPYVEAVKTLVGVEEHVIRDRTREWFEDEVRGRLRPGAAAALQRHREAGDRLVLATSSTRYAADCALEAFGLDEALCTDLEVVDGRFTGRIASFALGDHKLDRVQEWAENAGIDLGQCAFYTDSVTDLAVLDAVGNPVVVHPDRRLAAVAAQRGWPVESWGTADRTA